MTLVEENRTGYIGFSFTWSIHNFSYCVQEEGMYLSSPQFVVNSIEDSIWHLRLYPKGVDDESGFMSYYLIRESNVYSINCVLSIRTSNGIFKERGEQTFDRYTSSQGYKNFLDLNELKGSDSYLDNDTLTLRCRIWKNYNLVLSVECYAYTKIKVAKLNYVFTLKDVDSKNDNKITMFNQTRILQSCSLEFSSFNVRLLFGGSFGDDTIHFAIERAKGTKRMFLICVIHLLDADGRVAHSVQGEHLFDCYTEIEQLWTFPFVSKRKLLSKEKNYMSNGILTIRCEFSLSTEAVNSGIDRIEYSRKNDLQLMPSPQKEVLDTSNPWKKNMQRFYEEGKYCDVTIHTPNRKFPVHKAILCAQSEVFSAMFERDMKENLTGVVEIEDLEDDTVSKMLMFLYTDSLEDLDFSTACKLYFAADKYRMTALRHMCLNYLMCSLDISNVCDVLDLADTHQDQELKSFAQNFVLVHDYEIINSEDWKKLAEAKAHLTFETLQLMVCKKYIGCLKP